MGARLRLLPRSLVGLGLQQVRQHSSLLRSEGPLIPCRVQHRCPLIDRNRAQILKGPLYRRLPVWWQAAKPLAGRPELRPLLRRHVFDHLGAFQPALPLLLRHLVYLPQLLHQLLLVGRRKPAKVRVAAQHLFLILHGNILVLIQPVFEMPRGSGILPHRCIVVCRSRCDGGAGRLLSLCRTDGRSNRTRRGRAAWIPGLIARSFARIHTRLQIRLHTRQRPALLHLQLALLLHLLLRARDRLLALLLWPLRLQLLLALLLHLLLLLYLLLALRLELLLALQLLYLLLSQRLQLLLPLLQLLPLLPGLLLLRWPWLILRPRWLRRHLQILRGRRVLRGNSPLAAIPNSGKKQD